MLQRTSRHGESLVVLFHGAIISALIAPAASSLGRFTNSHTEPFGLNESLIAMLCSLTLSVLSKLPSPGRIPIDALEVDFAETITDQVTFTIAVPPEITIAELRRLLVPEFDFHESQIWLLDESGYACALQSLLLSYTGCVLLDVLDPEIADVLLWEFNFYVVFVSAECWNCFFPNARYMCQACRRARFCSLECQRSHWKEHQEHCQILSAYDNGKKD